MTPDPITTARKDFAELITAFNESANDAWRMTYAIDSVSAALDYAEAEITRLTSQLEQADRVIKPFAETAVWADNNGYDIADFDMLLRGPGDTVCGHLHAQQEDFSRASQWIKGRQAKTDASPVQPVLEWRESTLFFNGGKIGSVKIATAFDWTCTDGPPWAYAGIWSKMYTQVDTEDQGRAMLENEARQWLSGGDK